jgi:Leucine-rich repeat (LRR) protein
MAVVGVQDPVDAAVARILSGPTENIGQGSDESSPGPGGVSIDLSGGRHHFCDDDDAHRIAEAWLAAASDPTHITALDLSLNKISDAGAAVIVNAIAKRPCRLSSLDLNGNDVSDTTVALIADQLLANSKAPLLHRLDLSSNSGITDAGVTHLVQAVVNNGNTALQALLLRATKMTNAGLTKLCAWIEEPECPLRVLHVSGNSFTEAVLNDVAAALKTNVFLTDLNLSNSMPKVSDVEPLVLAAANHPRLLSMPLALDGVKREHSLLNAAIKRNKVELKIQGDYLVQLKRAHREEVDFLKSRIAKLESQLAQQQGNCSGEQKTPAHAEGASDTAVE